MTHLTISQPRAMMPQSLAEMMQFADVVAHSEMVPKDFRGKPANVLVAVQWGAEIGLSPLQSLQNIALVNGRPAVYGDSMLALVWASGLLAFIEETQGATGAICVVQRKGHEKAVRTFTVEQAKQAGLWKKAGPWTQYPERMLQMRARGLALRDIFPDVLRGMYIAEEAQDIPRDDDERTPPQHIGKVQSVPDSEVQALPPANLDNANDIPAGPDQKGEIQTLCKALEMDGKALAEYMAPYGWAWGRLTSAEADELIYQLTELFAPSDSPLGQQQAQAQAVA